MSTLRFAIDAGVAEIVLNRPDKMNAMNAAMVRELIAALESVESEGARACLVRGEGKAFCSGRDLSDADPLHEDGEQILREEFNPLMAAMAGVAVPTIAAVQGACLGTGLGLAMACDIVYAADDARVGSPFARIGAVLDSGAHRALVSRIGPHRTLELVYTGRLLSGREAAAWGLVNRSVAGGDLARRTRDLAASIARGPTSAFKESKAIVRRMLDAPMSFEDVLAAEAAAQGRASRTHDYQVGISAFLEKRRPSFTGS
ncbi:MAG: enoyl-CoA hydratase/isomerase family protein [Candidatus Dormibacteraeota bacterium]|nr:enoyl-CoA hydratase/isomerase family protein [Candidatus Dormibacteraeota bacterium]MBV9524983.1 enoyl-CoA hydratase/isomerase family protein [Candidatus Dormibacteraeota bacterium]